MDADSNDSKDVLQKMEKVSLDRQVIQNPLEFVSHPPAFGIGQKLGKNEEQMWIYFCKIFSAKILDL